MSNRYIQLAFDGEKSEKTAIDTGISQGSLVSLILFLIYIRFLFKETNNIKIRIPSYVDDIVILAKSESLENNYQILENTAKKLMYWGQSNGIEFDRDKTELIHFYQDKTDISELSVQLSDNLTIKPQQEVKWLGIWFNRKLSFNTHVNKVLAKANRVFH